MRIIICSPGNTFSKGFRRSYTELLYYGWNNGIQMTLSDASSCNIYYVRTMCLSGDCTKGIYQKPFQGKVKYDYLLWLDSDMIFTVDDFKKLFKHKEDIISGIYNFEGGKGLTCGKWDIDFFKANGYMPYFTEETIIKEPKDDRGLVTVDYTGFGFLLVKYGVFERMEYPWFFPEWTEVINDKSVKIRDFSMEDVAWSNKARELGFKIYVDPKVKLGHEKLCIY